MNDRSDALGVYVHWPYCTRICPYCDFNVHKNKDIDADAWANALIADLDHWAAIAGPRKLRSIYFGGGTPSLAPPQLVGAVIDHCRALWSKSDELEITLESNPTDVEQERFKEFRAHGVNRLSLGVQSLDDDALEFLGRNHDAGAAMNALSLAQKIFANVSVDLIYALPGQGGKRWREELETVIATGVGHLSLYQLTIEQNTAFAKAVDRGAWTPLDDDAAADFFDLTQTVTEENGLPAYEISNHAKPGGESAHNINYWRYGDYVGVGPGAHGRITIDDRKHATENIRDPSAYLTAVGETGCGAEKLDALSDTDQLQERIAMGLRMTRGIKLYADDHFYQDEARATRLRALINDGFLADNCGRLAATDKGRQLLDRILIEIFK